jgi:hypothetical protein
MPALELARRVVESETAPKDLNKKLLCLLITGKNFCLVEIEINNVCDLIVR